MKNLLKKLHLVVSILPLSWCMLFAMFVLVKVSLGEVHWLYIITTTLMAAAFISIWIWILLTLLISFFEKRWFNQKWNTVFYIAGTLMFVLIVFADLGGYYSTFID